MKKERRQSAGSTRQVSLKSPRYAWPTIALLCGVLGLWTLSVIAACTGYISLAAAGTLNALLAYVSFTPMHDAAHRAVARPKWINAVVGRLAGIPLTAPFVAFRIMHLAHHRDTNDQEHDPDLWSGLGPWYVLPLRWLSQDLHYYVRFVRTWDRQVSGERIEVVSMVAAKVVIVAALCWMGYGVEVLCLWLIPARIGIAMLAFAFDYLPHRPHVIRSRDDRFRATHIIEEKWLTIPLLSHNYHLIHHLYPAVPFYRYGQVWEDRKEKLMAKGARVLPLFAASPDDGSQELEADTPVETLVYSSAVHEHTA